MASWSVRPRITPVHRLGGIHARTPSSFIALLVALALLVTLSAGCGDDDGGGGTIDLADSFASAAVCNGEPSDVNPPATDPVSGYVYLRTGEDQGWTSAWFDTFGDQQAIVGDDATVILCVTVTESAEATRCPFEDDGEPFELVMMEATYTFSLRNADGERGRPGHGIRTRRGLPVLDVMDAGRGRAPELPGPDRGRSGRHHRRLLRLTRCGSARLGVGDGGFAHPFAQRVLELHRLNE